MELGQHVMVQNQRSPGNQAKKWDRTGVVVECPGYDKYTIRMDGSGNVTDRNRKYLAAHEDHIPEAPQLPAQEDPQGTRETLPTHADAARTPPSPAPKGAAPQTAVGDVIGAISTPRRSAGASRPPKRYIEEC